VNRLLVALVLALALAACGDDDASPSPTHEPSPSATVPPTATAAPTATPAPTPTATYWLIGEVGFPVDPNLPLGVVEGAAGSRTLAFDGDGPTAYDYALNDQPSDDADAANRSGWNCRTHFEYEGIAAVDFYVPIGTPIYSTTGGTATLYAISTGNDFDRYGVDREPYIGNPDRANAPVSPFPGPSGGLGVYVEAEGDGFLTTYGHLDLELTAQIVGANAYLAGFSADSDWKALFSEVPQPRVPTAIASWPLRRGDVIGYSGDAGYSEAPHLHYTIQRPGGPLLCPTQESGFEDGGWLFR
jgi:murein DD-endopeptidase MepM/ murein hydrolase activator NlpD